MHRTVLRDRTTQTVLLAIVFGALAFTMRPTNSAVTGMEYGAFLHRKMTARGRWDLVLAGDSRSMVGLLPSAMQQELPNTRIYNFGFDHNGYSRAYLDAMESMLDPSSLNPTLLLGATPQSLTPEASANSQFAYLAAKRPGALWYDRYIGRHLNAFAPYDLRLMWAELGWREVQGYHRHYSEDGSVPSWMDTEDTLSQIRRYQGRFEGNQVSDTLMSQLIDRVRAWTESGVTVYATRLPTSQPMRDLETRESGFDEAWFVTEFEAAGGRWIPVPSGAFRTYDGSHLREESAGRLSRLIAERIHQLKARGTSPLGKP